MQDTSYHPILFLLKRSESGMTADELSKELKVTLMAVHRPLASLEDQGLVRAELLRKPQRGRPVRMYRLTEKAEEVFPKSYSRILLDFLEDLGNKDGISKIRKLFEARFRKSIRNNRNRLKGKDLPKRVKVVSSILREGKYMPEHEKLESGKYMLRLMNCPISQVAREYPDACSCEQHFLSELLQAKVQREHHILNGNNFCSYVVREKT